MPVKFSNTLCRNNYVIISKVYNYINWMNESIAKYSYDYSNAMKSEVANMRFMFFSWKNLMWCIYCINSFLDSWIIYKCMCFILCTFKTLVGSQQFLHRCAVLPRNYNDMHHFSLINLRHRLHFLSDSDKELWFLIVASSVLKRVLWLMQLTLLHATDVLSCSENQYNYLLRIHTQC